MSLSQTLSNTGNIISGTFTKGEGGNTLSGSVSDGNIGTGGDVGGLTGLLGGVADGVNLSVTLTSWNSFATATSMTGVWGANVTSPQIPGVVNVSYSLTNVTPVPVSGSAFGRRSASSTIDKFGVLDTTQGRRSATDRSTFLARAPRFSLDTIRKIGCGPLPGSARYLASDGTLSVPLARSWRSLCAGVAVSRPQPCRCGPAVTSARRTITATDAPTCGVTTIVRAGSPKWPSTPTSTAVPDVHEHYERARVSVRRETDRDFNDRVDLIEEFDPATSERVRSVEDVDYDGTADLLVLFQGGEPVFRKCPSGRHRPVSARAVSTPGPASRQRLVERTADDQLAPLEDPFRTDLAMRAARVAAGSGDCVGLSDNPVDWPSFLQSRRQSARRHRPGWTADRSSALSIDDPRRHVLPRPAPPDRFLRLAHYPGRRRRTRSRDPCGPGAMRTVEYRPPVE